MPELEPPELRKLYIYLTDKCNEYCRHCWVDASQHKHSLLNPEEINKQIDQAIPLGLMAIKVTGGEPLLFEDTLFEVLGHSSSKGLETRLETNSTLINDQNASRLSRLGVRVYSSLDGSSPESHDSFRNRRGSFEKTLEGILKLVANGVWVGVISCIHLGNLGEMDAIVDLCRSLNVSGLKFNFTSPYGRAKKLREKSKLLTTEQIINATRHIDSAYHDCGLDIDLDVPRVFRIYPSPGPRCDVLNQLSILSDGRYSLCGIGVTCQELTFGYITGDDLAEVWRNNEILDGMRRKIPYSSEGVCGVCSEYDLCYSHCQAYCIAENGSLGGPFPICQDAFEKGIFPKENIRSK